MTFEDWYDGLPSMSMPEPVFARFVWDAAQKEEREAIKQECRRILASYPLTGHAAADCLAAIDRRSNA